VLGSHRRSLTSFVHGARDGILDDAMPLAARGASSSCASQSGASLTGALPVIPSTLPYATYSRELATCSLHSSAGFLGVDAPF
jgi:hypothetical protein